jgi:hypothetical protein
MPDPTGAIGLLGLISTALQLYQLGHIAASRKKDVYYQSVRLDVETFLLARWAENVGIVPPDGVSPRKLSKTLFKLLKAELECIVEQFNPDASHLVQKYYPRRPSPIAEDVADIEPLHTLEPPATYRRILARAQHLAKSPFRAVMWSVRDVGDLQKLVDQIQTFREHLLELLPLDSERLERQLVVDTVTPLQSLASMRLLDDVTTDLSMSPQDSVTSPAIKTLRDAVRIKRALPMWGEPTDIEYPGATELRIPNPNFQRALPLDMVRNFNVLEHEGSNQRVVIEWRYLTDWNDVDGETRQRFEKDVTQLALLLSMVSGNPNFHVLDCLGFFTNSSPVFGHRYGLLFKAPVTSDGKAVPQVTTLAQALRRNNLPKPELGVRFRIAKALSNSVYHLLTTGWLYKGLRSHNILLAELSSAPDEPLGELSSLHLMGFEFSRPDLPGQISQDAADDLIRDFYRHPESTSDKWALEPYRRHGYLKAYDIYSLGVLLLEVGLWRSVENIKASLEAKTAQRRSKTQPPPQGSAEGVNWSSEQFAEYLKAKAAVELPPMVGQTYTEAVQRCLNVTTQASEQDPQGAALLAGICATVVDPLERCSV